MRNYKQTQFPTRKKYKYEHMDIATFKEYQITNYEKHAFLIIFYFSSNQLPYFVLRLAGFQTVQDIGRTDYPKLSLVIISLRRRI